jgi:hypothetical protein
MSHATESLAARGRAHTKLRELLEARATILHDAEREHLLDAADALLFDEPEAGVKMLDADAIIERLIESERWLPGPAEEVRAALRGCGEGGLVPSA